MFNKSLIFDLLIITFLIGICEGLGNVREIRLRTRRSLLDEFKSLNEEELWNFLVNNNVNNETAPKTNEVDQEYDFGSLFDNDSEEDGEDNHVTTKTITDDDTSAIPAEYIPTTSRMPAITTTSIISATRTESTDSTSITTSRPITTESNITTFKPIITTEPKTTTSTTFNPNTTTTESTITTTTFRPNTTVPTTTTFRPNTTVPTTTTFRPNTTTVPTTTTFRPNTTTEPTTTTFKPNTTTTTTFRPNTTTVPTTTTFRPNTTTVPTTTTFKPITTTAVPTTTTTTTIKPITTTVPTTTTTTTIKPITTTVPTTTTTTTIKPITTTVPTTTTTTTIKPITTTVPTTITTTTIKPITTTVPTTITTTTIKPITTITVPATTTTTTFKPITTTTEPTTSTLKLITTTVPINSTNTAIITRLKLTTPKSIVSTVKSTKATTAKKVPATTPKPTLRTTARKSTTTTTKPSVRTTSKKSTTTTKPPLRTTAKKSTATTTKPSLRTTPKKSTITTTKPSLRTKAKKSTTTTPKPTPRTTAKKYTTTTPKPTPRTTAKKITTTTPKPTIPTTIKKVTLTTTMPIVRTTKPIFTTFGTATTVVKSIDKMQPIPDEKYENVFDPKSKFDILDEDVIGMKATTPPSFHSVDSRQYPLHHGHRQQPHVAPVCQNVITSDGTLGVQCYLIQQNTPQLHPHRMHFIPAHPIENIWPHQYVTTRKPQTTTTVKPFFLNVHHQHHTSRHNHYNHHAGLPPVFTLQGQVRQRTKDENPVIYIQGQQIPVDYPNVMYEIYNNRHKRSINRHKRAGYSDGSEITSDEDEKDGITLAFVFDTTGSMGPELHQVKEQAKRIANSMLDNPEWAIYDYVFVPFHDEKLPNPPTYTRDHNMFLNVIANVRVQNGGDCPEKCLGGVLKAIMLSRPYSPIYVFTDAYAKDYRLEEEIISLIQRKHPQIFFLTTGYCSEDHELFDIYLRIAAASSGHVFQTYKTDVEEVIKAIQGSLKRGKVLLNAVNSNTPAKTPQNVPISIDKSLKEFTITASGQDTKINLLNPKGNLPNPDQIKPLLDLNNVKVINVQEPEPGVWIVKVISNSPYSVVSTGLSTINFHYGFSVLKTINFEETSKRPLKSAGNYLVIKATDTTDLKNVTTVKIINLEGTVLDTIPMKEISLEKGLFTGGPRIPPNEFFKLEINGLGYDGHDVKRVTTAAISPQLPETPFITLKDKIIIKIDRAYNLTCNVESLVPVAVNLFKYGEKVPLKYYNQSTDIMISFDKIKKNDEGLYICWARNIAGVEVKQAQVKIIVDPPKVNVNNIIITRSGETTRIPCIVESSVSYKITWWFKEKTSKDNFYRNKITPILNPKTEESTLIIPKTVDSDEGWYFCIVSNEAGDARGKTYLTVQELPSIMTKDIITFQNGDNISLECYVTKGNPTPVIIWYNENRPIQETISRRLQQRNSSVTLTIYSAKKSDEGMYKCDAVNSVGKATRDVKVIYEEKPSISATQEDIKVKAGSMITMECVATGYPTPKITWSKNGDLIQSTSNLELIENQVKIINASTNNNGIYKCEAKNGLGEAEDIIQVFVGTAPKILNDSRVLLKTIELGKSDRLYCEAIGNPEPTFSWIIKRGNIEKKAFGSFIDIKDASLNDGGIYNCIAENYFGKAYRTIILTITGTAAPIIKKNKTPEIIKHVIGDHVELSCPVVQGNPRPNITWYFNGNIIDNAHSHGYILNKDNIAINQMTAKHVGQYECVAENPLGTDKKQLVLNLYDPPRIHASTTAYIDALEGSNVTLICNVTGDPKPIIIWSRVSGLFNFAMRGHKDDGSSNLHFTEVTAEDIGKYICRAKNIAGLAKREYALNVIVPPRIVKWPKETEVVIGNMVALYCNVYSLPKATIRWLKNNSTLLKPNAIYGSYLRFYATSLDNGQYTCIAENKAGQDRADVNVVILEPPKITLMQPKIEILRGDDLSIYCNASGRPKPEIVWYFQGQSIKNQKPSDSYNELNIENVTESHNGFYTCVATNKNGNVRKTIEVKVLKPPIIKQWESMHKVIPGEEVTITCDVTGIPLPYISWYKDGLPLDEKFQLEEGKIRFIAERNKTGEYTCRAMNKVGNDSTSLTLILFEPPIFAQHLPNTLDILLGETADLPCAAFGDPKPKILWRKLGNDDELFNERIIPYENGTLKIINIGKENTGVYLCIAENKAGNVERQITLNVLEKPQAKLSTEHRTIQEGDELILHCDIKGTPKPRLLWTKDGDVMPFVSDNETLRLIARPEDAGTYGCLAENMIGKAEDFINITVHVAPSIKEPNDESIIGLKGEDITLTCRIYGIPRPKLTWLRNNTYILHSQDHYKLINESLLIKNLTFTMADLYTCEASNIVGKIQKSFRIAVHARPEIMDKSNTNVTLLEGDDYHITCTVTGVPTPTVYWRKDRKPLLKGFNNGEILVIENNTLVLTNARPEMSGIYYCMGSNIHGGVSKNYSIFVIVPSRLMNMTTDIHHIEINASDTGTLQCPLNETIVPTKVIWLKDEQPINNIMHERADDVHFIMTTGTELKITEAFPEDTGSYKCIGIYSDKNISSNFIVDVLIRPQFIDEYPPEEYIAKEGTSLTINCRATGHPAPKIHWKHIDRKLPITNITVPNVKFQGDQKELLTIDNIKSKNKGRYTCTASNKLGKEIRNFQIIVKE